jgi:hypothetical protein
MSLAGLETKEMPNLDTIILLKKYKCERFVRSDYSHLYSKLDDINDSFNFASDMSISVLSYIVSSILRALD